MDRTVRYGRIGEVVIMIFPEEQGAKEFILRIETQSLLKKIGMNNVPLSPLKPTIGTPVKGRIAA